MRSNKTLFAAPKFELHTDLTCHDILFILFILYRPSITIREKAAGWIWTVGCGWLAPLYPSTILERVRLQGGRTGMLRDRLLLKRPPRSFIPAPHRLPELTVTMHTSPAALALTSQQLRFVAWLPPVLSAQDSLLI